MVLEFKRDDTVNTRLLNLGQEDLEELKDHLILYFTGYTRSALPLLDDQDKKTKNNELIWKNLDYIKELGKTSVASEAKDYLQFGLVMHDHWIIKNLDPRECPISLLMKYMNSL